MNFNTRFTKTLLACALALMGQTLVSCDNIDADDRYLEVAAVDAKRVVLIEDFTGQNCVNCPDAHAVIESLEQQYGEGVVAVSVHGGGFAISRERTDFSRNLIGLGTPEGEYYNSSYGINAWPKGVINGRGGAADYATWASLVRAEIERPSSLAIEVNAAVEDSDLKIDVELLPQADLAGSLYVWVLESGIVARQTTSAGLNREYVHNNVLRAAVNGNDGEQMLLEKGVHRNLSFSIALRDNEQEVWNPDNLSVVVFLKTGDGVEQVAKANVKQ